jgi:hypothetical protein
MNFLRLLAGLTTIVLGYGACGGFDSKPSTPKLKIALETDKLTVDFGKCDQFQNLQAVVKIANCGTDTVKIYNVAKSCACSETRIVKQLLEPGETTELYIAWKTGAKSGKTKNALTIMYGPTVLPMENTGYLFLPIEILGDVTAIVDQKVD